MPMIKPASKLMLYEKCLAAIINNDKERHLETRRENTW